MPKLTGPVWFCRDGQVWPGTVHHDGGGSILIGSRDFPKAVKVAWWKVFDTKESAEAWLSGGGVRPQQRFHRGETVWYWLTEKGGAGMLCLRQTVYVRAVADREGWSYVEAPVLKDTGKPNYRAVKDDRLYRDKAKAEAAKAEAVQPGPRRQERR